MDTSAAGVNRELQRELTSRLPCEVRFDRLTRLLFSTDASVYQVEPLGVAFPQHEDDLQAIVGAASSLRIPLIARGAGTGLAGQAIGAGLIVDCSRHLTQIHHLDPESRQAVVAPGVVGAALNAAAAAEGLMYGPDPASADRATFGGMIGSNATGAHSIRYGMTADHLLAADVVLSDGSRTTLAALSQAQARQRAAGAGLDASIHRVALDLRESAGELVRSRWPRTWRRSSGYNLDYLVGFAPGRPPGWYADPQPYPPHTAFNLAPLLAGSEGTLAILCRATVNLVPRPRASILVLLAYDDLLAACEAAPGLLTTHPAAVELIPRTIIDRARSVPEYARKADVFGDPAEALLIVEYSGETPGAARAAAGPFALRGRLIEDPRAQADLWAVRKAGLGLLLSVPGDRKPVSFIEDVAVPADRLAAYVQRVTQLMRELGTDGIWYAHASAGCLHMRPLIDLKSAQGVAQMRAIADGILAIVQEMGGALSGEHGDGISHTEYNPQLFGEGITQAFRRIKDSFDPDGLLNPGRVVAADGSPPPRMDASLRYGPMYRAAVWPTVFSFDREQGLARAIEDCNGAGVCLKRDGVMCPSYQALREEAHSTRGRANALRAAISGRLGPEALTSDELKGVLDLCLACKGCKAECPSAVDMARIKSEHLAYLHSRQGVPLRSRLFGEIAAVSRAVRPVAGAVNALAGMRLSRGLLDRVLGISRQRVMPAFARQTFRRWFAGRPERPAGRRVVLFVDTFVEHNHPEVGRAAVEVLEAAGCQVLVAEKQGCCGRAHISKGLLDRARALAAHNLDVLTPFAERGIPIVGLEPSCLATLRDEYRDFFPRDPRAALVAERSLLIEEFLTMPAEGGGRLLDRLALGRTLPGLVVHGHCHAKAIAGTASLLEMLRAAAEDVELIQAGCCGMAGSFGYEREHYDLSMQIAELSLLPEVRRAAREGKAVVAAGASCRAQIRDGTGVAPLHPVQALAQALGKGEP